MTVALYCTVLYCRVLFCISTLYIYIYVYIIMCAGCTVTTALLVGMELFVANAGDSRTILCHSKRSGSTQASSQKSAHSRSLLPL